MYCKQRLHRHEAAKISDLIEHFKVVLDRHTANTVEMLMLQHYCAAQTEVRLQVIAGDFSVRSRLGSKS